MSKSAAIKAPMTEYNRTASSRYLVAALRTFLIGSALTTVSACGKTDSFDSLSSAKAAKSGSAGKNTTDLAGQPEDQSADAPQSVAGMYLTCGDYTPTKEDTVKDPSIACNVSDDKDQRVALQNLQQRRWTVRNKNGDALNPFLQESSDSVRIFGTRNTGGPNDVKTIELEAVLKNSNKRLEKIKFNFADGTNQLALVGVWNVVRTAPSGSGCLGSPIKNPILNAGKLEINLKPGSTSEFTAVVNGGQFTLDYNGATSITLGTINKTAVAGTLIFSGTLSPSSKSVQTVTAKGQNVLPADLNPSPILVATTGADGSVISMRMDVMQPCYGLTYWDFKK